MKILTMELAHKSLLELTELINTNTVSSQYVWKYFLERTKKHNPTLNAFNNIHEDGFQDSPELLR
jgi:Asp-tRNA(Asn)/Glu-tRNA(Gln) amidotransferase A subunit family amidase